MAQHVDIDYDVIPGITAIQALTARHRIPLNDIGEPVLITTGRRLAADGLSGSAVVMLDGDCSFRCCPPDTRIWWGAYLGTPDELLVSGTVGEVGEQIAEAACRGAGPPRLDHGHVSAAQPVASGAVAGSAEWWAFLLRAAVTGFALWIVTLVVSGIDFVGGDTTLQRVGIILVVAVIFGLVNAIIKPIVQIISIPLYILTLGLFHIVINALMLWITSWITEHTTHWGLYIDDFWWTAIWAAIVLSIVSWALSLIVGDRAHA